MRHARNDELRGGAENAAAARRTVASPNRTAGIADGSIAESLLRKFGRKRANKSSGGVRIPKSPCLMRFHILTSLGAPRGLPSSPCFPWCPAWPSLTILPLAPRVAFPHHTSLGAPRLRGAPQAC